MKRGKIVMKRIENPSNRQVSFSKRKKGLIKKGTELKVLCDATVAVIIYSSNEKLYEYSSKRMESILAQYNEDKAFERAPIETVASEESQTEMDALKAELEKATSEAKMLREQVGQLQHELAMKQNSGGEVDTSLRLGLPVDTTLKLGTP